MSKFNNFSHKLFGIVMVSFCCTSFNRAFAEDPAPSYSLQTLSLCSEGYYLSRCEGKIVGTNWLKGIRGTTLDYYSYGSSDSDTTNISNLRKFFTGLEKISYIPKDSNQATTANPSDYVRHRNSILNTFCTNNGELADIECKKCPNNAKVPASSVKTNISDNKVNESSWRVYTIADCYMEEFSDHTGTYIYAQNTIDTGNNFAKKCYFSTDVKGSELVSNGTTSTETGSE